MPGQPTRQAAQPELHGSSKAKGPWYNGDLVEIACSNLAVCNETHTHNCIQFSIGKSSDYICAMASVAL